MVDKTAEEMDMSNVVIQDWKDWESYDEIVSAVDNANDISLVAPKSVSYTELPHIEKSTTVANDHYPFLPSVEQLHLIKTRH